MWGFKKFENFTIMESEKRTGVKVDNKTKTSQNFQRLVRYEKDLNEMSKKIQELEKSLADDDFDEEQINKMRLYEKEVFHLVFQIDKVLIDDNERAYDDKQEFDELTKEQIAVQDKAQSLFDRAKFLREQLNMLQDWNDDMDDEDRNESLDILTLTEIIFLPLGFLTGYFGMNFAAMGEGTMKEKRGTVYGWSHSFILLIMFGISIIIGFGWIAHKYDWFDFDELFLAKHEKGTKSLKQKKAQLDGTQSTLNQKKKEKATKNETDGIRKGIRTNVARGVLYSS